MEFSLCHSLELLERTPGVLVALLDNLSEDWTNAREAENTWSVKEVVAHLIVCEKTNWMVRAKIILSDTPEKVFVPIDMNSHVEQSKTNSMKELLNEFRQLRMDNISKLKDLQLNQTDFTKIALHPTIGEVNLQQLISTWTTHDLSHMAQVLRIMAKQNKDNVGPFATFLKIVTA